MTTTNDVAANQLTNTQKAIIGVGVAVSVGWGLAGYRLWSSDEPTLFSSIASKVYGIGTSLCQAVPNYIRDVKEMPMVEVIKPKTIAKGIGAGLMTSVGGYACLLARIIDKHMIDHEIPQELRNDIEKAKKERQAFQEELQEKHEEIQLKLDVFQTEQETQVDQITVAMEEREPQGKLVEQLQTLQAASDNATELLEQALLKLIAHLDTLQEEPEDLEELKELGSRIQSQKGKKEELTARLEKLSKEREQLDELERSSLKSLKEDLKDVAEMKAQLSRK